MLYEVSDLEIKKIIKSKKIKNILITTCEVIFVAAIIFGALMFLQNKINKESTENVRIYSNNGDKETSISEGIDKYYIEVNIKNNTMIIYQYLKDKQTKQPYKVFNCSVGKNVKKGTYKTGQTYYRMDINDSWHKYNTQFDTNSWIQSVGYSDKYDNTLIKSSYRAIGTNQKCENCILLYTKDAEWVYNKCKNTEIKIVTGKKNDKLPLQPEEKVSLIKYCGWEPTDLNKHNPYRKYKNAQITVGAPVVYVEKGHTPEYLSNLIALDEEGKNIANLLEYKKISTKKAGTHKVQFSYKTKSGKQLTAIQKFKVIDTIPPIVTCSSSRFVYEVASRSEDDLNTDVVRKAIENKVRYAASCNENDVRITVSTVSKDELQIGSNVVVVKAQDLAGNVGSCQVICEITIKEKKYNKKYKPPVKKSMKEQTKKQVKKNKTKDTKTTEKAAENIQ